MGGICRPGPRDLALALANQHSPQIRGESTPYSLGVTTGAEGCTGWMAPPKDLSASHAPAPVNRPCLEKDLCCWNPVRNLTRRLASWGGPATWTGVFLRETQDRDPEEGRVHVTTEAQAAATKPQSKEHLEAPGPPGEAEREAPQRSTSGPRAARPGLTARASGSLLLAGWVAAA